MIESRQVSTTTYPITFFMLDSADHITGKTGLSPTVTLSKNGSTFAACAGAVSELGGGWYALAGNATDRNTLGSLSIHAVSAGADACDKFVLIVSYDPFASVSTSTVLGHTLSDVMLDVARLLGGLRTGISTGGSVTTLVDTSREEEAEFWKNGTLWITSGAHIGNCLKITSFVDNTITFATTLSSAIASGTEYSILPPEFTFDVIRMSIQASLSEMGDIVGVDTTLTTDADDEVYTLPNGVYNILKVEIAGSDADPYNYSPNYYWKELAGLLYFIPSKKPGSDGYKIRLWYKAPHAGVYDSSDTISDSVDRNWLKWLSVTYVLRNSLSIRGKDKAISIDLLNQALQRESEYRNRHQKASMSLYAPDPRLNP